MDHIKNLQIEVTGPVRSEDDPPKRLFVLNVRAGGRVLFSGTTETEPTMQTMLDSSPTNELQTLPEFLKQTQ